MPKCSVKSADIPAATENMTDSNMPNFHPSMMSMVTVIDIMKRMVRTEYKLMKRLNEVKRMTKNETAIAIPE